MHIRLDRFEHLGFHEHLAQVEPVERVLLHHAHNRRWKIGANVAQPARDVGCGTAQIALPVGIVQRIERAIHRQVCACERQADAIALVAAEQQPPAAAAFVGLLIVDCRLLIHI